MISRVADSCFWLCRYLERVENIARLLQVHLASLPELPVPAADRWRPLLVVCGEEPGFLQRHGEKATADGSKVLGYLTWDRGNPASLISSLQWARENARTTRETISLELWETLNEMWLWMSSGAARKLYERDRYAFYSKVKQSCQLVNGVGKSTLLDSEPYDFMRLGTWLERASQTARILDVKYHLMRHVEGRGPVEPVAWLTLLRSCAAGQAFFQCTRAPLSSSAVVGFLLGDQRFPRSVRYCLTRAKEKLDSITQGASADLGRNTREALESLVERVQGWCAAPLSEAELHDALTVIVDDTQAACVCLHKDFFDPAVPELAMPGTGAGAERRASSAP